MAGGGQWWVGEDYGSSSSNEISSATTTGDGWGGEFELSFQSPPPPPHVSRTSDFVYKLEGYTSYRYFLFLPTGERAAAAAAGSDRHH